MNRLLQFISERTVGQLAAPVDSMPRGRADSTIGNILPRVTSSHSAVCIFDDSDKFLGLVSPKQSIYKGNLPESTRAESILFRPPHITIDTSIYDAVNHMLATRVYSLPIFDESGRVTGIIHGDDILKHVSGTPGLLKLISENAVLKDPITAPINSTVGQVYQLLKEKGVSRVIFVSLTGALEAIVTRSDLMKAFIEPSLRRRFAPEGSAMGFHSRAGDKKFRTDSPARIYAVTMVDTLPRSSKIVNIVSRLISSPYKSVVLVDSRRRPSAILSIRGLLQAMVLTQPPAHTSLITNLPISGVPPLELRRIQEHLAQFEYKLKKRLAATRITITTEELKNTKAQTNLFKVTVIVTPVSGEPLIAVANERSFLTSLQAATDLVEKRRRRSGLNRRDTELTKQ